MKKSNKNIHEQAVNMLGKEFLTLRIELLDSDKYYRLVLDFPDGSFRELYISYKTLYAKLRK